jgi:hypothetical protein
VLLSPEMWKVLMSTGLRSTAVWLVAVRLEGALKASDMVEEAKEKAKAAEAKAKENVKE